LKALLEEAEKTEQMKFLENRMTNESIFNWLQTLNQEQIEEMMQIRRNDIEKDIKKEWGRQ
jgi:hypothetical protein